MMENASVDVVRILRLGMLGLVGLGTLGMITDLRLIGHDEDSTQLIPLAVGGVGLAVTGWAALAPRAGVLRFFQFLMLLYIGTGVVGMTVHAEASAEFQWEMDPTIAGVDLMWKVLEATAPPTMAPAILVQLGLLGLLFTYKHPGLSDAPGRED